MQIAHNTDFNWGEFAIIKSQAGLNSYKISVKHWVEQTQAIGIQAKAGRYGGTYAHPDIAFEFGMWISAEFKIYLVKEFQRLKEKELKQLGWDWSGHANTFLGSSRLRKTASSKSESK